MIDIMRLTPEQVERFIHLQSIIDRQAIDRETLRRQRDYYDGNHDVLLSPRQRDFLGLLVGQGNDATWSFNLMRNVVDTIRERLCVVGFTVDGETAAQEADNATPEGELADLLWDWWVANDMDTKQIDLYRKALRDGVAYLLVTWDEEADRPVFYVHAQDGGLEGVTTHLDPETHLPQYYVKYWTTYDPLKPGATGKERKTVYLPGEVRKYQRAPGNVYGWEPAQDPGDTSWPLPWLGADGRPLGFAVWPFRVPGGSELSPSALALQDSLNTSMLDLLAAAAAGGFPIMSVEYGENVPAPPAITPDNEEDEETGIELAPGRLLEVYGGRLNRLPPSDTQPMIATVWTMVSALSAVTGVPAHRLRPFAGAEVPSGEALKQLEAGLVAKATERTQVFTAPWAGVMTTAYRLAQKYSTGDLPAIATPRIKAVWANVNTRSELLQSQVGTAHKTLGVPDEMIWQKVLGYTPDEVAAFRVSKRRDQAMQVAAIAASLRQAMPTQQAPVAPANPAAFTEGNQP